VAGTVDGAGVKKPLQKAGEHMQKHILSGVILIFGIAWLASCSTNLDQSPKTDQPVQQSAPLAPESQQLLNLLPEDNQVPNWTRGDEVRFFGADKLWEYIDGAADGYLTYGFQEVVTAEYNNAQKSVQVVVDVYRMKDERNAFGIYAAELNPDSEFLKIGAEGYFGGMVLNFWSGPYYAKITAFEENPELKPEMLKLAEYLGGKIGAGGSALAEAGFFPSENLLSHSLRYFPKDVLGQTYLVEGFEARYIEGVAAESKMIVTTLADSDAAKEALAKYRQFIATSGKVQQDLTTPGEGGFAGKDSYYGNMAAVRAGNRIIIALAGTSAEAAVSRMKSTVTRIK
jgi:hypothetical protein